MATCGPSATTVKSFMLRPLGNIAVSVLGMLARNLSFPRIGLTPGRRPIISNSKLSETRLPRTSGSSWSRARRKVVAASFCLANSITVSLLVATGLAIPLARLLAPDCQWAVRSHSGSRSSEQLFQLVQRIAQWWRTALTDGSPQQGPEGTAFLAEQSTHFPLSCMRRGSLCQDAHVGNYRWFREMADDTQRDLHLSLWIGYISDI